MRIPRVIFAVLIAFTAIASADSCASSSVTSLTSPGPTSCSMGGLTFTFTGWSDSGNLSNLNPSFNLSNLTVNPTGSGFTLSASDLTPFSQTSSTSLITYGKLYYTVNVLPGMSLVSMATTLSGSVVTPYAYTEANTRCADEASCDSSQYKEYYVGDDTVYTDQYEWVFDPDTNTFSGYTGFFLWTSHGGKASWTSSTVDFVTEGEPEFQLDRVSQVPEPGSMLLVGTGMAALLGRWRRRKA